MQQSLVAGRNRKNTHRNIDVLIQCPGSYCEVQSSDPFTGERAVEELVSLALTNLFDMVITQDVSVIFPSAPAPKDSLISISIHALGCDPLPIIDHANLDCVIEACLGSALVEFFDSFDVEHCIVA